ncbi:hypothetical protein KO494_05915 [Lacinutrix sp. C3R15]|uniref:DUF6252 family protein n=1 Tax=Flavobacteriaceae TaxID=49546 RepID=UPI001C083C1F|nr:MULTISPECIES: DUF6252 family protein [Flavobacteriaceae]MBU2939074.1 hypothetical protein [Lacinutrix sp. C3R15]MDO6622389.1 DUF6252 family protein [Oceanihabitans sp. 1_MG-2023]
MKKLFLFIVSALFMVGCGEDLEFNTPALQGKKDSAFWRADYYTAEINGSGQLIISGGRGSESIVLKTQSASVGSYLLGEGSSSEATFVSTQDIAYSTNNEPDPIIQIYPADGEIVITDYSESGNAVSGTFWFNAFSESGLNKVNFSQGVFYEVPISSGGSSAVVVSCDDAVAASAAALLVYQATDVTSSDYASVCSAYEAALTQQITSCGDDTGVLQGIIDGLNCADGTVVTGTCQTCSSSVVPETEYCDNQDGTMTVTVTGFPSNTVDLQGVSFEDYISGLETSGMTCN